MGMVVIDVGWWMVDGGWWMADGRWQMGMVMDEEQSNKYRDFFEGLTQ